MIANRKRFLMISLSVLTMCLCACSEMIKTESSLPDYMHFDQLIKGYGVENAMEDDCVVFVDAKLISGEDIWKAFMGEVEKKQSCCVRIASYYSAENIFSLIDLSYKDLSYYVDISDGLSKEYKYLNHYEIDLKNNDLPDSTIEYYILTNQENVTYDEIERSMISAVLGDALDFFMVYVNTY